MADDDDEQQGRRSKTPGDLAVRKMEAHRWADTADEVVVRPVHLNSSQGSKAGRFQRLQRSKRRYCPGLRQCLQHEAMLQSEVLTGVSASQPVLGD